MSTNPLRREGGYWKPVLDYEHWDDENRSGYSQSVSSGAVVAQPVRHDLCHHCGSEFVVDSPYCRMCGRGREEEVRPESRWAAFHIDHFRTQLGLTVGASVCLVVGILCVLAAIIVSFVYTAGTLVDWQAIQIWRTEWLIAAGVAFLCGILLNSKKKPDPKQ